MNATRFQGFGPNLATFFEGLAADNSKAYFEANRATWQREIREPLEDLLDDTAAEFGGTVKIFRQNRDIRFSHDKSPYKTNTYGVVMPDGRMEGGLYASISAETFYAGTGYYGMAKDQTERFRAAAADEHAGPALVAALADAQAAGLEIEGEALKTAPKGFPKDHPRIELLKYKWLILGAKLPATVPFTSPAVRDHAWATWRAAKPVIAWFDKHVGPSTLPPDASRGMR